MRALREFEWLMWEKTIDAIGGPEAVPLLLLPGGKTMVVLRLMATFFRSDRLHRYFGLHAALHRHAAGHLLFLASLVGMICETGNTWAHSNHSGAGRPASAHSGMAMHSAAPMHFWAPMRPRAPTHSGVPMHSGPPPGPPPGHPHFSPGHPHSHGHSSVFIAPLIGFAPPYYYAPPYYAAPYYAPVPESPLPYVEQAPNGGVSSYWLYCSDPPGYYPQVQQCLTGWQPVPAGY